MFFADVSGFVDTKGDKVGTHPVDLSPYLLRNNIYFEINSVCIILDMWSAGCVMAQLYTKAPIFEGSSENRMRQEVMETLGTPTLKDMKEMKANYNRKALLLYEPTPLESVSMNTKQSTWVDIETILSICEIHL